MTEQRRIRGRPHWDVRGMVFTELHEEHELTPEGFRGISLQVGANSKFYYLDNQSLRNVEETLLEMWLEIRKLRKEDPNRNVLLQLVK